MPPLTMHPSLFIKLASPQPTHKFHQQMTSWMNMVLAATTTVLALLLSSACGMDVAATCKAGAERTCG